MSSEIYKRYSRSGFWAEDFFSVALDATTKSIETFSDDKGTFYSYWHVCVTNALHRFIKDNYLQIKYHVSNVISFDGVLKSGATLHDCYGKEDEEMKQNIVVNQMIKLINDESNDLTQKERIVLLYYLEGYKPKEIAVLLNTTSSAIYRRFNQAVKKMRDIMKDHK